MDKNELGQLQSINKHLSHLGLDTTDKIDDKLKELSTIKTANSDLSKENAVLKSQLVNTQNSFDKNMIILCVGGALALAGLFYFLGGNSLGGANVARNLELPSTATAEPVNTSTISHSLSPVEQIEFSTKLNLIWGIGEGLFGTFEFKKGVDSSNGTIYQSEYVTEAKRLMENLLKHDSSWREAISKLNEAIVEIFRKSKDLRIHQNSEVSGDTHFKNWIALVITSVSMEGTGGTDSARHGKEFIPAIIKWLQSFISECGK